MNKWIAVSAMLAISATGALAQRGMGRGVGQGSAGPRIPAASRASSAATKQTHAPKVAGAQHQAKTVQFNATETARLQPMLPAGMTVETAAEGFRNRGQFMAAVQVSKNLGIPFADLKAKMTGTDPVSLGRAIQDLRPAISPDDAKQAAKTAEVQARQQEREMRRQERRGTTTPDTTTPPTTTTPTTTTPTTTSPTTTQQ
jgi:hypothetical protein